MDLGCDYAGLAGAAEVAERQATHQGDVSRYVGDVCARLDAFRGAIQPLRATYAAAVASACDGLDRSGRAAQRWGGATRDTAADLAEVDALARRVVRKVAELLPGVPDDLVPVAPEAPEVAAGETLTSPLPLALDGPGTPAVAADRVLGLDPEYAGLLGHAADHDGPPLADLPEADRTTPWRHSTHGPLGEALGGLLDLGDAADDATDAVTGIAGSMAEAARAGEDSAAYDDFIERAAGAA